MYKVIGLRVEKYLGKTGMDVFEVDAVNNLPDTITDEIIVLGNRHKHITLQDIEERVYNKQNVQITS